MVGIVTAAVVVSAGSAIMSHKAGKKASRAQQEANEAQRKINQLKNKQAKRAFLRNFRQAQANLISASIASGVGLESSAVQGGVTSVRSQRDLAVKEFGQMDTLGGEMTAAMNSASRNQLRAQTWSAVSSFAQQFIAFGGGGGGGGGGSGGGGSTVAEGGGSGGVAFRGTSSGNPGSLGGGGP